MLENIFMPTFFSYPILIVVYELKRQSSLKNFAEISEIPSETQFYEYLTDINQKSVEYQMQIKRIFRTCAYQ